MTGVSATPSKIPYGGFSPVRLQASFQTNDLRDGCKRLSAVHIRAQIPLIRWLSVRTRTIRQVLRLLKYAVLAHEALPGLLQSRATTLPTSTRSPRGPWLTRRFCCPPGSSLTMASSEPLTGNGPKTTWLRPRKRLRASGQRVPNLLCLTFRSCRLPYHGGPKRARLSLPLGDSLRPVSTGSASALSFSRLQSSLDATA